jgi:uncharacterized protein
MILDRVEAKQPVPEPQFHAVYEYVVRRLRLDLPSNLFYHGPHHTLDDVLPAARRLCDLLNVTGNDKLMIETAALYHDTGYIEAYAGNESVAARIASETLPGFGFSPEQVDTIGALILATQMPQQPQTPLQQIMCDADLDSLGREDFYVISFSLHRELTAQGGSIPLRAWFERQVDFLQSHAYFTEAARQLREANKQARIQEIKQLLGMS